MEDKLTDLELKPVHRLMSVIWKRIIITICCIAALGCAIISTLNDINRATSESLPETLGIVTGGFLNYFLIVPALCCILVSPFCLIRIKNYKYREKLWAFTLVLWPVIQPFVCLVAITIYLKSTKNDKEKLELFSFNETIQTTTSSDKINNRWSFQIQN